MHGLAEHKSPIKGSHSRPSTRIRSEGLINLQKRFRFLLPFSLYKASLADEEDDEEADEEKLFSYRKNRKN